MRLIAFVLFWFLYLPLLRLASLLLFWNQKLETRERFEKKNKFEFLAQTFRDHGITADYCFQFSSEGEFQQVMPLIEDALGMGKKVELVFFSPSVEKGVMRLAARYREQVRYLRYPLVRLFPFIPRRSFTHWVTAKTLLMVRYDLFPEFLLWSLKNGHTLKLLWFTFKKERVKGKGVSLWKKLFLKNAQEVVYASEVDAQLGRDMGYPGKAHDFRIEQIRRRVEGRLLKFQKEFPVHPALVEELAMLPAHKKLIMGNAWPSDLFLLRDVPSDVLLVIVPHKLDPEMLGLFREGLDLLGREVFEINPQTRVYQSAKTILLNQKGLLCELYADFPLAYVGGGFEGSIHSVLEPLVAGGHKISVGPFHDRSTEYDVVVENERMTEVNTPEQFLEWLNSPPKNPSHDKMKVIFQAYQEAKDRVLSC